MAPAPLLRGVAFPLQLNPDTGNLVTAEDAELIQGHISSVIEIEPGENPMRPNYGTPGAIFTTQPNFGTVAAGVERVLRAEIPATFRVTSALGEEGEALLSVDWEYRRVDQSSSQSGTFQIEVV